MNEAISKSSTEDRQKAAIGMSTINTLIGLWLIVSAFVLTAFSELPGSQWNNVVIGILVTLFSIVRASGDQRACWSWSNVVLGLWLIVSPFALGFSHMIGALWHNIIAGGLVALMGWSSAVTPSSAPERTA